MKNLVSTDWLEKNLDNVRIFDGSWHLPQLNRNALKEFQLTHIKNANFFDIDKYSNHLSSLPHMLPKKDDWEKIMSELGVKIQIILLFTIILTLKVLVVFGTLFYILIIIQI